ncbi:penicillin-binding protein [Vespertiliibacter pulmonis]|uniref:Penicillin-binding protein activator LpoA n=1 Tax=Vespertiliibacter pulmonis TaxID=1443036 RepID=A0A3N4VQB2_9PAST|nr:penicillin-binding protein activator [Vespertiliibacter pulmonis]QLB21133.1 penicillin-binding protein [Vespertiliibacter pulmonis]RPE83763.1 hypothetical protein EDC46_0966 [Vespertiliibacter pulmonis]
MSSILVQTQTFRKKMQKAFIPSTLALFLSACTGSNFFKNDVTESLKNEAYSSSEFYINKAEQTNKETQQSYRLLAIRKLIDENKIVEAENTIAQLNLTELNDPQKIEYQLLSAQLFAMQNNNSQAVSLLRQLTNQPLSHSQLLRVYRTQVQLAENQKDTIAIVRARSQMDSYLSDNRSRQENNDKIWEILRNANRGMLEKANANAGEIGLDGWLALAVTYNQNINNPTELPRAIENWKQRYPNHSAAQIMPTELHNLTNFQQTQLNTVALLLPLSGEAKILGDIIKKGFDDAKGDDTTAVQVYDTDSTGIAELVGQAKQQGAQTIIGPLLKTRVAEMIKNPGIRDLNVLTLNATPNAKAISKVCYYGLSPEAEARSAAEKLHRDGITSAVVIAPQDDFGQRSSDAFAQRWRQLTNLDTDIRYYHQPADSIESLKNTGIPANSGIYLLGTAEQLSEMKQNLDNSPLAGKFPLYTSSRSNSPNNGPDFRLTMEGVKFSEIPLLSDPNSDLYKKAENLAESDFSMMRLYAMGSDSWSIANKFNEIRQIPGYKVSGLTGILKAGTHCNIERDMTWLQYQNGSIVPAN